MIVQPVVDTDKDPRIIEIYYNSVFEKSDYLQQRVLIEVGSRSLIEPSLNCEINSIISSTFPNQAYSSEAFTVSTVVPQRTFLEKIFLLHEEFSLDPTKIRSERLTRHLYDLEKLMDTEYGINAIKDIELYENIVHHREKFNALRGLDYSNHIPSKINIVPPSVVISEWEADYKVMSQNMIYGSVLSFEGHIQICHGLVFRFFQSVYLNFFQSMCFHFFLFRITPLLSSLQS